MRSPSAAKTYRKGSPQATSALFFGELSQSQQRDRSPLDTVEMTSSLVRELSASLMLLAPETWAAVHESEQLSELAAAGDELKVTVAAMRGDPPSAGTATCLPAQVRDVLRQYRRRQQFAAANLRFTDPGARDLLSEILNFDRWQAAHLLRCQACGGAK